MNAHQGVINDWRSCIEGRHQWLSKDASLPLAIGRTPISTTLSMGRECDTAMMTRWRSRARRSTMQRLAPIGVWRSISPLQPRSPLHWVYYLAWLGLGRPTGVRIRRTLSFGEGTARLWAGWVADAADDADGLPTKCTSLYSSRSHTSLPYHISATRAARLTHIPTPPGPDDMPPRPGVCG